MLIDEHKVKVRDFILSNKFNILQPIEIVQLRTGSFKLITIQEPSKENGYKRLESLQFDKPTKEELNLQDRLIERLNSGLIH